MAKSKGPKKLIPVSKVPTAPQYQKRIQEQKVRVTKAKATATKEGKFDKYTPQYRKSLKCLKRIQRRLGKDRVRFHAMVTAADAAQALKPAVVAPVASPTPETPAV